MLHSTAVYGGLTTKEYFEEDMHFISSTLCFVLVLTLVAICDGYAYGMGTGLGGMSVKDAKVVALRKICQNRGFLWPVFSRIRAALIRESTSQRKPVFWNISRTVIIKLTHHGHSQETKPSFKCILWDCVKIPKLYPGLLQENYSERLGIIFMEEPKCPFQ